jgi:hypothetical protein
VIPKEQEQALERGAKEAVKHWKNAKHNLDELIKAAQKAGYLINPKTGELTKMK